MSNELNDFLRVISEGKKDAIESNPGKKALKHLGESLHASNPFLQVTPNPKQVDVIERIEVSVDEVVNEELVPVVEYLPEATVPEVKPAAEQVPMDQINKYLARNASFQQPDPEVVDPNFRALQEKIKFLEQAIGKIAATGPGSGAAEIYNLDMPARQVTGDYSINRKDYYVGVNCDVKSYITLPISGRNLKNGRMVVIKDESGHAQLTPIKLVGTIDNDPNGAEIRINNGAIQLIYRDGWRII